jgi:hypothetical protein
MKIVRLIFAILAALWTVGVIVGVISEFGKHGGTRGIVDIAASVFAVCFMLVITIWLFQGVFPKSPRKPPAEDSN